MNLRTVKAQLMSLKAKILMQMKRVWLEITILTFIGLVLFLLPIRIERQGLELFLYKILLFSASQVHAHATRKLFFPYIDFNKSDRMKQTMVIAIHVMAAYLYAEGG